MYFRQCALHCAGFTRTRNNHQRNGKKTQADTFAARIQRRSECARDTLRASRRLYRQRDADTGIVARLQRLLQRRAQRGIVSLLCRFKQRVF
jgi:hypothetical protein